MNIYYQEGGQEMGQEEQLMQLFQAFADIVQDDEFNTAEEVMQMFMELAPEEQQAFVQQAIQIIQQEQGEPELESNPEEELMEQQEVQPMMQQGGINPQKIQQILQAYASSIGEDPNVILQQFQQMQPEEQQQALQQIVQQLQGGGEEQMQMQEQQQMQDGGYVNNTGYLDGYESSNNPYNIIPNNRITMEGVRPDIQYIKGTDNLGNTQYMEHGGEYKFDGDFVVEEPVYAQKGKKILDTYDKVKKPLTYAGGVSSIGLGVNNRYSKKEDDPMFEDFLEIFDPTGISSYDDVYRAYNRYKQGNESGFGLGLEIAGAVPVLGKFGKVAKAAPKVISAFSKGLKYLDLIGDSASVATLPLGDYKQNGGYTYMKAGGEPYYETLLKKPDVRELITMRENKAAGYLGDIKRLQELEKKYGTTLDNAEKQYNRILRKQSTQVEEKPKLKVEEKPKLQVNRKGFTREEKAEYDKLLKEEKAQNLTIEKSLREEDELNRLIKEEADVNAKKQLQIDAVNKRKATIAANKEAKRIAGLKAQIDSKRFFYKKGKPIPLEDLSVYGTNKAISDSPVPKVTDILAGDKTLYGTRALMTKSNLPKITPKKLLDNTINAIPGKSKFDKLATAAGILTAAYNLGNPFALEDEEEESKPNQSVLKNQTPKIVVKGDSTGKPIEMIELSTEKGKYIGSDGNEWLSTDGGKNFKIVKKQTTSANQDKPKIKLPDKRTKAALAEEETPFVLQPPPVPTEIPEQQNTFDYRQPLIIDSRFDEYFIPEEDRTVELNPNVFNRSNVGVGKKFFNQTGGYNYAQDGFKPRKFKSELDFNSRLNPGSSMNMGAKSDGDFEYAYPDKKKIYYVNGAAQLDPINQYDTMPMGANSMNYEAPNAESMKMWNRGSDRILDLSNYADRFGVEHFGANTKPVSDQNVDRKSKFQQFMDKYGKKADMQFDPVPVQSAPLYNLLKASEPLAPQFRGQMDVRYAEKPMVDPRPFIQELQNQYALSSRNINSNSPTGMAWQSNLQAKMKAGVEDILNKTSAANQQTAAENELSRINAFNQEQQANNTYNQQYVQSMLQAQAAKDLAMGESLSSLDQLRANAVKARNNFKSLAVMTPGLKPVENFNTLLTGSQGFNIDKDFQQLVSTVTQAKTPEEVAAAQKIYSDALKKKQAAAKAATETKQIGGKINDFFRKRY